jgi:hypothetical protein
MQDRQKLVDAIKGYIYSHPNIDMNLSHEMAKFVQNLYDTQVRQGKTMGLQRELIEAQKSTIALLKNEQANIKWTNINI